MQRPLVPELRSSHSRPCTGGALEVALGGGGGACAAGGGVGAAGGGAGGRFGKGWLSTADTRASGAAVEVRPRRAVLDRLKPHEWAIDGPAVYPTTAPASAPMGPNTTAPDNAPSAASLPRRSSAIAPEEVSASANAASAIVRFMPIPLASRFRPAGSKTAKCGGKSTILGKSRGRGPVPHRSEMRCCTALTQRRPGHLPSPALRRRAHRDR
jgi:hypothetical protein